MRKHVPDGDDKIDLRNLRVQSTVTMCRIARNLDTCLDESRHANTTSEDRASEDRALHDWTDVPAERLTTAPMCKPFKSRRARDLEQHGKA